MIPKNSRLPASEFRARDYETIKTPFFLLKEKANQIKGNRIGVVIGAVVEKRASRRNFWKRQAKAQLRLAAPAGKDFLVIFSPKIKGLTKADFKKELVKAIALVSGR